MSLMFVSPWCFALWHDYAAWAFMGLIDYSDGIDRFFGRSGSIEVIWLCVGVAARVGLGHGEGR
jgi:hypothetical protein